MPGQETEIVGAVAQDLGLDRHARVLVRQEIPDVPVGEPVGGDRGDERGQRAVEAVEVLGKGIPEDHVRKAF